MYSPLPAHRYLQLGKHIHLRQFYSCENVVSFLAIQIAVERKLTYKLLNRGLVQFCMQKFVAFETETKKIIGEMMESTDLILVISASWYCSFSWRFVPTHVTEPGRELDRPAVGSRVSAGPGTGPPGRGGLVLGSGAEAKAAAQSHSG